MKILFFLSFFLLTTGASGQEYLQYYSYVNKAETFLYSEKYNSALTWYEKAFKTNSPNVFDLFFSGCCYFKSGKMDSCLAKFEAAIKKGYPMSPFLSHPLLKGFSETQEFYSLSQSQDSLRNIFLMNHDTLLINKFSSLIRADKEYRANCSEAKSKREGCEKWDSVRFNNGRILMEITRENGFPGFSKLGFHVMDVNLILLHSKNKELFEFFNNRIKHEVIKGEFKPSNYAYWVDGYITGVLDKKQMYGTVRVINNSGDKVLTPIENINKVDERRLSIGLKPLKTYCEIMGFKIPEGYER